MYGMSCVWVLVVVCVDIGVYKRLRWVVCSAGGWRSRPQQGQLVGFVDARGEEGCSLFMYGGCALCTAVGFSDLQMTVTMLVRTKPDVRDSLYPSVLFPPPPISLAPGPEPKPTQAPTQPDSSDLTAAVV
jgi:hypothetical protein